MMLDDYGKKYSIIMVIAVVIIAIFFLLLVIICMHVCRKGLLSRRTPTPSPSENDTA